MNFRFRHGLFFEPDDPDPDRRWKAIIRACRGEGRRHKQWPYLPENLGRGGMPYGLYVSPDEYRWSFEAETNHWQGPSPDFVAPNQPIYGGSDCLRTRWDPKLGKYIGNTKHRIGPDLWCMPVFNAARVVGQVESDDLIHWSRPRIIAYPDGEDVRSARRGMHGIYEADGYFYESMWLNNFCLCTWANATNQEAREKAMSKTRQYIKRNWLRLAASRDGRHWYYFGDRKPFVNYGDLDSWKPAYLRAVNLATTGGPIVHDDKLLYYYRGSSVKAEPPARSALGLATLRRDGFASLNADESGGVVITRPLVFEGKGNLFINAKLYHDGFLSVSVVDEDTAGPLKGFTEHDSVACINDSTRAAVQWRQHGTLAMFKQQKRYVRLAFHLRSAALYSFWIE